MYMHDLYHTYSWQHLSWPKSTYYHYYCLLLMNFQSSPLDNLLAGLEHWKALQGDKSTMSKQTDMANSMPTEGLIFYQTFSCGGKVHQQPLQKLPSLA